MKKSDYRRFRIKTVEGANDFASMQEVVKRRYGGTLGTQRNKALPLPDLILIDGGIGQLGAAMDALRALGLGHLSVIGLAKAKGDKEERIYCLGIMNHSYCLPPRTPRESSNASGTKRIVSPSPTIENSAARPS